MIFEPVRDVGLSRLAETDQVRRDAVRDFGDCRENIAPDVGRGGVAMEEERDRRIRAPHFPIGHFRVEHGDGGQSNIGGHDDFS